MSLKHALIGLLAEQPASGWDLTRRFEDLLGTVWPAGHPQIYGELRKLEADGFIEIDSEGPRRRKAYRVTESGIEEVRRWLTAVERGPHAAAGARAPLGVLLADDPRGACRLPGEGGGVLP